MRLAYDRNRLVAELRERGSACLAPNEFFLQLWNKSNG